MDNNSNSFNKNYNWKAFFFKKKIEKISSYIEILLLAQQEIQSDEAEFSSEKQLESEDG